MIISRSKLTKELSEIEKMRKSSRISPREEDIILTPLGESLYHWRGVIKGPPDSAYSEGHFELDIQIPEEYPISPPKVKFLSKVFHPNVHFKTGEICLDILKPEHWTPAWTLESLCRALINLLQDPNADSPLNCDAGNLIRAGDVRGYRTMTYMYTIEHVLQFNYAKLEPKSLL